MRPEDAQTKLMSSVHPPGPIRVIGPLSNSYDFAKVGFKNGKIDRHILHREICAK